MKQWNLVSAIMSIFLVFALGKLYRPLLDTRLSAAADLLFFCALFFGCRLVLRKMTSLDD
jgi:hypothetical protein